MNIAAPKSDATTAAYLLPVGGLVCLAGVVATGFALPRFYAYRSAVGGGPY